LDFDQTKTVREATIILCEVFTEETNSPFEED